jgi:hypothetical protein
VVLAAVVVLSSAAAGSVAGSDAPRPAADTDTSFARSDVMSVTARAGTTAGDADAHAPEVVHTRPRSQVTNGTPPDDDAPVTVQEGGTYFVGQTLERSRGVPADGRLDLYRDGQFDAVAFSDSQGVVRVDTAGFPTGAYSLRTQNGTAVVSFRLVEQTLDVSFGSATVSNGGRDTDATLSVSTNRRSPVYYVTGNVDGEWLDADASRGLFGGAGTAVGTDTLRLAGTAEESFSLNASGLPEGRLTLVVRAPDAEAVASANVTVTASEPGTASFAPRVVQASTGDTVTVGLRLERTDRATLQVGTVSVNYRVTLTVVDGDGDGEILVRWDTSAAGTGSASAAFTAADPDDAVRNASRSTGRLSGPLAAEPYPISVRVGGTETDVGTVSLRAAETPRPCGRDGAALVDRYHDNLDAVPALAEGMLTAETIHLSVSGDEGGDYTAVTDSEMRVTAFRQGVPGNATLVIETDCETVTTVLDASEPGAAFSTAYDNDEITVRGATFPKTVLVEVSKLLYGIGRALGAF